MCFLGGWAFIAQPPFRDGLGQACCSACPPLRVCVGTGRVMQRFWLEGGTQAWSRIVARKMYHNAAMCSPWPPQNHPTAPAGPLMPCLIPPLGTFGLDFPILAFPYATSRISPFLPTLKKSRRRGYGFFNCFCVYGPWHPSVGCPGRGSSSQRRGGQ